MSDEKRVVIISGSPKPPDTAASDFLAARAAQAMREGGVQADVLNVRRTLNQKNGRRKPLRRWPKPTR